MLYVLFTREFWLGAADRAIRSAGQFGLVALGADFTSLIDFDLIGLGAAMGAGALMSLLTSIALPTNVPNYPDLDG